MAGSAVVGALRVSLGLDSAQFSQGLKSAQSGLQRFGGLAKQAGLAIGAAMVTAGGVVAVAMKGIIDEADKMSKLSQSLGVPIADLSRLAYAAQLADVDIEALGKGIKRLSAGMLDATESATGPAARSFAMLGVSVTDAAGKLRPVKSVIEDLADRFEKLEAGPAKTALAMRLFGKSGADMIPMLNEGSAGFREMYAEAEELGIVLDEYTGKAAEAFNDNLTRLGRVKDGIITKITAGMLPALVSLTDAMVGAAKQTAAMRTIGAALGWALNSLVTVGVLVGAAFIGVASDIGAAWDAANRFVRMDFSGGVAAFRAGTSRTQELLRSAEAFVGTLWKPSSGPPPALEAAASGYDLIEASGDRATRSVDRLTEAEREAKRAAEELAREAERVFDSTRTPAEKYTAEVDRLTRMLKAAAISQDTFNRAMAEARRQFDQDDPIKQAARALEEKRNEFERDRAEARMELAADQRAELEAATYDGIRGGLEAAADGNLGQYLAARLRSALLDGLADSLTSLLLPGKGKQSPLSGGLGNIVNGMASWLKLPGFKTGGSFKVGGSGGPDSQITAFRSTPGEMVDVRRPGQTSDAGGPYFDLRGAVMTQDLLEQMNRVGRTSESRANHWSTTNVPGLSQSQTAKQQQHTVGRKKR